jgi:hypothetical protein
LEKASGEMIPSLPAITEDELLRMEQKNKIIAERALASIGKGVSTEAQGIFDALNKTYSTTIGLLLSKLLVLIDRYV